MDNSLGIWGEDLAAEYLENKGYRILQRNFRCRTGEIDVIASDKKYIVFVEVKARKNDSFASARSFVTAAKQRKILSAAKFWLVSHYTELQPRFDVIEIYSEDRVKEKASIEHIENAFETEY